MLWCDEKFLEVVETANIKVVDCARYMDDVRVWLRAIIMGWRWIDGQLMYRKCWRMEKEGTGIMHTNPSPIQRLDVNLEVGNLEQSQGLDWRQD